MDQSGPENVAVCSREILSEQPNWSHAIADSSASRTFAVALLILDVFGWGFYYFSFLICPVCFLLSLLKNAIVRTPARTYLVRIAVPFLAFGAVLIAIVIQWKIAELNAARVIAACEEFKTENGRYPKDLSELVPQYLLSVPRAKYCLLKGGFDYYIRDKADAYNLTWVLVPPFGREYYVSEQKRWGYLD